MSLPCILMWFFLGVNDIDYSRFPDKNLQMDWLKTYLMEYKCVSEVTKNEIEYFYVLVNKFVLATHLFWYSWSLIQAEHSYIDFDFIEWVQHQIRTNESEKKFENRVLFYIIFFIMFGLLFKFFFRYAAKRIEHYLKRKPEILAMELPKCVWRFLSSMHSSFYNFSSFTWFWISLNICYLMFFI